jgi:hypothetical protein
MQVQFTNKIDLRNGVKGVVFGPSGVGKTVLISTAPRPFIFNAEKGLLSLRKYNIPYVTISTGKELEEAFIWATKSAETKNYDTFALDSLSEIAEVITAMERKKNPDARKYVPAAADSIYGLVRSFRDLPNKHVVCIAKQQTVETGDLASGSIKTSTPLMPGEKLQNNLPYFWDVVLHMAQMAYQGQSYRVLRTQATPYYHAKDRSGMLSDIEPPDLTALFKKAMS